MERNPCFTIAGHGLLVGIVTASAVRDAASVSQVGMVTTHLAEPLPLTLHTVLGAGCRTTTSSHWSGLHLYSSYTCQSD